MRVAFGHYGQLDDISGVTTWVATMASRLQADGFEVVVFLLLTDAQRPGEATCLAELRETGVRVISALQQKNLRGDVKQVVHFLQDCRPDAFLPQCRTAHYAAAALAGQQGLPWLLAIHSDDPDYWSVARWLPPRQWGGRTVAVSGRIRQRVLEMGFDPDPLEIPYGVVIPEIPASFGQAPFRVAYCGRLWEHQKRASLVIQTLIRACQRDASIEAVVIGDGYARQACENKVEYHGLAGRIHFTGPLSPSEVPHQLARCQAILLMSDFEGLPVALLEAMALGLVPVVREIPSGIPELVFHETTGLLVSEDPGEAAEALVRISRDSDLWHRCSQKARGLVTERFSAERSYQLWKQLILSLQKPKTPLIRVGHCRIRSLPRPEPLLVESYRRGVPMGNQLRQKTSTSLARLKDRIRRLL